VSNALPPLRVPFFLPQVPSAAALQKAPPPAEVQPFVPPFSQEATPASAAAVAANAAAGSAAGAQNLGSARKCFIT